MKLYELTWLYSGLMELMDKNELSDEELKDTLDAVDGNFELKAENIIKMIRQMKAEEKAYKEEKERFEKLQKARKNQGERLREYLKYNMIQIGKERVKTIAGTANVGDKKTTYEVVDTHLVELAIPSAVKWEPKVSKTELNKALPELLKNTPAEKLGVKVIEGEKTLTIR